MFNKVLRFLKKINKPKELTMYDVAISQKLKKDDKIKIGEKSILESLSKK